MKKQTIAIHTPYVRPDAYGSLAVPVYNNVSFEFDDAQTMSDAFCGHAGNNYTSEAVLMTGCVDMVVSEFNCTLPGIEPICAKLNRT